MKGSKAAERYANSLMSLALEQGSLDRTRDDMLLVYTTCSENNELELMLHSPIIKTDTKISALKAVFGKHLSDLSMKFVELITRKGRESFLILIAQAFVAHYKKHMGIVEAEVTSAASLSDSDRKTLKTSLAGLGKTIELIEVIDPSVIGGMKVKVGDQRIDATIQKKLNELKLELV